MSWSQVKNYDIPIYSPISFRGRVYKMCRLPNGILAFIVSDPSTEIGSCSLSVATGSHNDPVEIPGLAHLCEHMILSAGSKKYPNPDTYHKVLAESNGTHNAYTTGEQTTYCFELPCIFNLTEFNFEKLLDIFSSSFKDPLFKEVAVNKEIYAIESEHDGNTSNLTKIFYHATRLLANDSHPFSKFSTGNITTLSKSSKLLKTSLKKLLMNYFKSYYHATNMTLCIKGPQSINILTKYALIYFNNIEPKTFNEKVTLESLKSPISLHKRFSFSSSSLVSSSSETKVVISSLNSSKLLEDAYSGNYEGKKCFEIVPSYNGIFIKSNKQPILRLLFPIDLSENMFSKSDTLRFVAVWCELFGDESKNSLCDLLKAENLITECFAFHSIFVNDTIGLIIELSLTGLGTKNIEYILNFICRQAVNKYSNDSLNDLACFLSEFNSIDIIRFLNKGKINSPMNECSDYSSRLLENLELYDPSFILKEFPLINDYNLTGVSNFDENFKSQNWWINKAEKFQKFLVRNMNPKNLRILLLGNSNIMKTIKHISRKGDLTTDHYYGFEYLNFNLPLQDEIWIENEKIAPNFEIPNPNTFLKDFGQSLPNLFLYLNDTEKFSRTSVFSTNIDYIPSNRKPHLLLKREYQELWILENIFKSEYPTTTVFSFEISNLRLPRSPVNTMHLEVLGQLLGILISTNLYPSLRLGYTYEIGASTNGDVKLTLSISGYPEGIKLIIKNILYLCHEIATNNFFVTHAMVHRARVLTRRKYEDAASGNSVKLATIGLLIMLEKHMWTLEDRFEALEDSDVDSFKEFGLNFFTTEKYIKCFIQGDCSIAYDLNNEIYENLIKFNSNAISVLNEIQLSTHILKSGDNLYFEHPGDEDDINNCINYFIQTGNRDNKYVATLTSLTDYIMNINLITELRTKRQIGYVVLGGLRSLTNTIGLYITIMSLSDPIHLEASIDEYFWCLERDIIDKLTEHSFQTQFITPFITSLEQATKIAHTSNNSNGMVNLMDEVAANVRAGDSDNFETHQMNIHKEMKNKIFNDRIKLNLKYNEAIDLDLLRNINLKDYLSFFKQSISITSRKRSKISIHILSPMAKEEIVNRKIYLQLQTFLKIKGLTIRGEDLRTIVAKSNGRPGLLLKEILKYFNQRNEAKKLCFIILKEIIKMITMSLIHSVSLINSTSNDDSSWNAESIKPAIPLVLVANIKAYK